MYSSKILYTGSYVPDQIIKNNRLSELVDTNDEWIISRTGIKQRHITIDENTSDLAAKAAESIMKKGGINPLDVELIIVATISGDYMIPSTACLVQHKIGAVNAVAFDLTAACSGFIYGLSVADKFIKSGVYKNAIVIGAEVLSKYIDWNDRVTCVLFGDGAAGAYLERSDYGGLIAENIGSDGSRGMSLTSGNVLPKNAFNELSEESDMYIRMDGKAIFDFATRQIPKSIKALVEKTGIDIDEIKYVVPHQANSRIVEVIARKIKVPFEKFYLNIGDYGNTSSASIPIALNEMADKGMLERGDKIILTGFGGGLTWGSILIEW